MNGGSRRGIGAETRDGAPWTQVATSRRRRPETTTSNDVSLRKVILGGTPGHRTVKVPPWHGIDPEP